MDGLIQENRSALLRAAVRGVEKWCAPPDEMVGNRFSDQYWIALFTGDAAVNSDHAHRFLTSFQLTNHVRWDKEGVAGAICKLRTINHFEPLRHVPLLAQDLQALNKRNTRQTSAASKIATLAKPQSTVFIWDKLANRSARFRDWIRGERNAPTGAASVYLNEGQHDYRAFYSACERALHDERARGDFRSAVDHLIAHVRRLRGPMADASLVPSGFIERRLLDKLMYAEGWVLDRKKAPPDEWINGVGM